MFVKVCVRLETHEGFSVGPVGGAAVARLIDLALLLQAAGLTALAGTNLEDGERLVCGLTAVLFFWRTRPPVHPELDGDAAAESVVAGEAGCGGMGQVHSLQELLQGSRALDPPVLMAG